MSSGGSSHTRNVREYYDSFDPAASAPSRLTFYSDLFKRFPGLSAPDPVARLSFGCQNPVEALIEEMEASKTALSAPVKILDAGGGGGLDAFLLRQILPNAVIYNADISIGLLASGMKATAGLCSGGGGAGRGSVNFVCADAANLPFRAGAGFDFIISNALLNLVEDKEKTIGGFAELLGGDGSLVVCDIAFAGRSKPGPAFGRGKTIADGTYFAPTVECESDYPAKIFRHFKFARTFSRHEMRPDDPDLSGVAFAIFCVVAKKNIPCERETIPCRCGGKAVIEIMQNVDVSESPHYLKIIREGSLNSAKCPACGAKFSDLVPFYFRWEEKSFESHVFPASLAPEESAIRMSLAGGGRDARIIFGFEKFRETVSKL